MTTKELREIFGRRPAVPLRLHLKNGEVIDVEHPELTMVSDWALSIGRRVRVSKDNFARDSILVGPEIIDRAEPLPSKTTAEGK